MFEGIYTPIVTPFTVEETIDYAKLEHNLARWGESALRGILVLGSNGEFTHLSMAEKLELVTFVKRKLNPEKNILVGTGCLTTKETIELTKAVSDLGADAALVLPPFYYRGLMREETLYRHFVEVADASPIPLMIYNMPANTGINLSSSLMAKLSRHERIIGAKDSSANIVQIAETVRDAESGFLVFAGSASFMLPALVVGAKGATVALGNIMPDQCCRLYDLFREGEIEEARKLQLQLLEINYTITAGLGIPALKEAMDLLGYRGGEPKRPLRRLSEDDRNLLKDVLRRCGATGKQAV